MAGAALYANSVSGNDREHNREIGNPNEVTIICAAYFVNDNIKCLKIYIPQIVEALFSYKYKLVATIHKPPLGINCQVQVGNFVVHTNESIRLHGCYVKDLRSCCYGCHSSDHQQKVQACRVLLSCSLCDVALRCDMISNSNIQSFVSLNTEFVSK